jgi:trans-2,3-dihydro-3-hydroxyanthranilate isomerase
MKQRKYLVYDVFTQEALAGNPLGVVLDCDGLDTAAMQAIAREFNLSESVFILPPDNPRHRARVRIFTPDYEMPFAGHPTVGSAVAIAELAPDNGADGVFVLEENIGPVRCAVTRSKGVTFAEFDLPKLPEAAPFKVTREQAAEALGLAVHDICFEGHDVGAWNAGVPYVTIPVRGLDAAGRAVLDTVLWLKLTGGVTGARAPAAYVYCREATFPDSSFHARMFAGHIGLVEDPATGSAVASFAGQIMHFERPVDGPQQFWIEQGIEMGRPSRIRLEIDVEGGAAARGRIGGHAVKVAEGVLFA